MGCGVSMTSNHPRRAKRQPASNTPLSEEALEAELTRALPSVMKLALAYAPRRHRLQTMALFALDSRLANLLRHSREPMLAQLRLSWWRETLGREQAEWPLGEPLLAALALWSGHHRGLVALVDGWEALTGPAPLAPENLRTMVEGRGQAFAALAKALGCESDAEAARAIGQDWALSDLAMRLGNPQEQESARALATELALTRVPRLPRPLRPLGVVRQLSARRLAKGSEDAAISPMALLGAMRVGLTGR